MMEVKGPPRNLAEAMAMALARHDGRAGESAPRSTDSNPAGNAFALAMRPPDTADDYVLPAPPNAAWDRDLERAARGWFFKAGIPQNVASGILQQYCRHVRANDPRGQKVEHDGDLSALRGEWGPDFDSNLARARGVVESSGGGRQLIDLLDSTGMGNNAWLIRTLAAVALGHA